MPSKLTLSKLAENPVFIEERKNLDELNVALFKVRTRIAEIELIRSTMQPEGPREPDVHDALAFASTGKLHRQAAVPVSDQLEELATLRTHERSLRQAIDRQTARLQQVESEHRVKVLKELTPEHKALMRRYLDALIALDAMVEEEAGLVRLVEAAGVEARFPETISCNNLGRANDTAGSYLFYRVRDIKAYLAS